jgi:hypothetical protein
MKRTLPPQSKVEGNASAGSYQNKQNWGCDLSPDDLGRGMKGEGCLEKWGRGLGSCGQLAWTNAL